MIREVTGVEPSALSGKDAFAIVKAKTDKGWDGVRDYLSQSGYKG